MSQNPFKRIVALCRDAVKVRDVQYAVNLLITSWKKLYFTMTRIKCDTPSPHTFVVNILK